MNTQPTPIPVPSEAEAFDTILAYCRRAYDIRTKKGSGQIAVMEEDALQSQILTDDDRANASRPNCAGGPYANRGLPFSKLVRMQARAGTTSQSGRR